MLFFMEAITANTIAIVLLMALLVNHFKKRVNERYAYNMLVKMIIINILQCIIETCSVHIDGRVFYGCAIITYIINSLLYINCLWFAKCWVDFNYVRSYGLIKLKQNKKLRFIITLPVILQVISMILNIFFPISFKIDGNNEYSRYIGYYLAFLLTYGYLALGVGITIIQRKRANGYLLGSAIWFLVPVLIASVFQTLFLGVSALWVGTAVGLVTVYLNMQDEHSMIDELSGLFIRQYMNIYIKTKIAQSTSKLKLAGIMIDVDKFKFINDNYGHLKGDMAISYMGQVLRSSIEHNKGIASRYGGDEFVMLSMVKSEEDVYKLMDNIKRSLKTLNNAKILPFKLNVSMGYTICQEGDDMDKFIKRMDIEMYKKKSLNKN